VRRVTVAKAAEPDTITYLAGKRSCPSVRLTRTLSVSTSPLGDAVAGRRRARLPWGERSETLAVNAREFWMLFHLGLGVL
jgi:hypothetical protein